MDSSPAEVWFAVKIAVALSPILVFSTADVIEWFLRRTIWRRTEVAPNPGRETARHERTGVAAPPG
jgi:hypothetical protein